MYEKEFIAIMSVVLYRVAGGDQIGVAWCLPAERERERERSTSALILSADQLIAFPYGWDRRDQQAQHTTAHNTINGTKSQ
jgi:hypothetical protein